MPDKVSLPLVSVVALCYNHEKYAVETLDSIIRQSYANIQLIIIDDCSTDNSVQVINNWIEENRVDCIWIPHKENQGVCRSLNEALTYCDGKYYQVISCDDIMLEHKIAHQTHLLESHPEVGMVFGISEEIDENAVTINTCDHAENQIFTAFDNADYRKNLEIGNMISAPSVLLRKAVFNDLGAYDEEIGYEDWDYWIRISHSNWSIKYVHEVNSKYRVLNSSLWNSKKRPLLEGSVKIFLKHDMIYKNTAIVDLFNMFEGLRIPDKIKMTKFLIRKPQIRLAIVYLFHTLCGDSNWLRRLYRLLFMSYRYGGGGDYYGGERKRWWWR